MDDREWETLYRELIIKLRGSGNQSRIASESVILDIENAATTRVEDESSADIEGERSLKRQDREDMSSYRLRPRTPREIFIAAVEILASRSLELPAMAEFLTESLNRDPENIRWKPDVAENNTALGRETFCASDLIIKTDESRQLKEAFGRLEELLEYKFIRSRNDNSK